MNRMGMATTPSSKFSAELELALGFRQVLRGELADGQRAISQALETCPILENEIRHLIPDWVMYGGTKSPIDQAHTLLDILPDNITRENHLRRHVLGQVNLAMAFEAYNQGHRSHVVQYILSGLYYAPHKLNNKGIQSIFAKTLLNRKTIGLHSESTEKNHTEKIPDPIVEAIETTLNCHINYTERIISSKRKIFLVRAGGQEFILHFLEDGKDAIARKIAIANLVRENGVPAPTPLVSSLSHAETVPDANWALEEKMSGSSFVPWNISSPDQINIVTELGRYLRQLHRIRVKGFGPVSSSGLDTPFPTLSSWLDRKQEVIAKAIFMGDIPEAMLPVLNEAYHYIQRIYTEPPVLCHCELTDNNILVSGGHISALIDWEGVTGNDPAYDVAVFLTNMSLYWYPTQEQTILDTFLQAYKPDDIDNFVCRVKAHRLFFIAGEISWLKQNSDAYCHLLTSIMNTASTEGSLVYHKS